VPSMNDSLKVEVSPKHRKSSLRKTLEFSAPALGFARHDAKSYGRCSTSTVRSAEAETVAMHEFLIGNFLTRSCRPATGSLTQPKSPQAMPSVSCRTSVKPTTGTKTRLPRSKLAATFLIWLGHRADRPKVLHMAFARTRSQSFLSDCLVAVRRYPQPPHLLGRLPLSRRQRS
jgi:hypothetical protein